jgi:hypothetical protein
VLREHPTHLYARFRFLVRPQRNLSIAVSWSGPTGLIGSAAKPSAPIVDSDMGSSDGRLLPVGNYFASLRVGSRIVVKVKAIVG